jgi:hypothetical protein
LNHFVVKTRQDRLHLICPSCHQEVLDDSTFDCECGTILPIVSLTNHTQLYPNQALLTAVNEYLGYLDIDKWDKTFIIDGNVLKLIPLSPINQSEIVSLSDLQLWRNSARIHMRMVKTRAKKRSIEILNFTKEKCLRNGIRPTLESCLACCKSSIAIDQIQKKEEMCLPRIMGLAIDKQFDGIHHGHEVADVKYEDVLEDIQKPLKIAIHLKSRQRPKPQGLGRSVGIIKALYTQAFYSAHITLQGKAQFDAIGISVPNTIHESVKQSLRDLLNRLGFYLILVDEDDWIKIMDAVVEQLSFTADT